MIYYSNFYGGYGCGGLSCGRLGRGYGCGYGCGFGGYGSYGNGCYHPTCYGRYWSYRFY
ncbi:keratin-associated protein 20-1 [Pteropus vampyrus]|uniref:Keratin-associated protein 20-1 n=1 Tax=Pteropus vampyrus TaxID=132908 RepID=A0A6P6CDZ8_PTEVA|nr:keratin-associated protein 20-1 [Pteropus vampyrus]